MRRALLYIVVGAACCAASAADRKSWNRIRYVGGTVAIKVSPYDWNTTLTVTANPDSIVLVIAPSKLFTPRQTIRIKPSQIVSLSHGAGAWRRVTEVPGAELPSKAPSLFGLFEDHAYLGIVYDADDGKRGAALLDSYFSWSILSVLKVVSGKPIEDSP